MHALRTRKAEADARERVLAGKCVCGCGRDAGRHSKLGLSRHCYYEQREEMKRLTKRRAAAYRDKLIREGRMLEPHEVGRIKKDSVFARAARSVS